MGGQNSDYRSSPTSPVTGLKSPAPPSPPRTQGQGPAVEAIPTGLRPLSLTPSYSDMSIVSAYTASPSGLTSVMASPAGSTSRLRPAPEDEEFQAAAEARDSSDNGALVVTRGGSALERRADGSF